MEQHPIPQNVTTFQFRLIGDMTLKQFGYLAGGAILAYVSYKLPLPFIITWPLALVFGLLGIGLAFVPVQERPMDVWILSFIKSIYSPTLYIWQKSKQKSEVQQNIPRATGLQQASVVGPASPRLQTAPDTLPIADISGSNFVHSQVQPASLTQGSVGLSPNYQNSGASSPAQHSESKVVQVHESYSPTLSPSGANGGFSTPLSRLGNAGFGGKIATTEVRNSFFDWLMGLFGGLMQSRTVKQNTSPPTSTYQLTGVKIDTQLQPSTDKTVVHKEETSATKQIEKEITDHPSTISRLQKELEGKSASEAQVIELQKELAQTHALRDRMENELVTLRQKSSEPIRPPPPLPVIPRMVATTHTPTVRIVTPESAPKMGLPRLTTYPNVVTGIIKDSDNNLLPGVLVTVRDKSGLPVRALKSNKLGQIAASTQLGNGTYTVEVEDPRGRYFFDRVQLTINGSIMPPIEILAKSQKQVMRTKLEKEIFGNKM